MPISRALTTKVARGTDAVEVLFDQFEGDPMLPEVNLDGVANALDTVAGPSDFDRMAALATDRRFGYGRTGILEWLARSGRPEGFQIVVGELEDPSVRALGIRYLGRCKPVPTGLRPTIEQYLDDPSSEVRKQAKLTLKKLPD